MTIDGTPIRADDPLTPFCGCGKPMRECAGACVQRRELIVAADGYMKHGGRVYAVTMEDAPCRDQFV